MNKLKPCPFCGNEAKLVMYLGRPTIACSVCPAAMFTNFAEDIQTLETLWNNRNEIEEIYLELARVHAKTAWKEIKEKTDGEIC